MTLFNEIPSLPPLVLVANWYCHVFASYEIRLFLFALLFFFQLQLPATGPCFYHAHPDNVSYPAPLDNFLLSFLRARRIGFVTASSVQFFKISSTMLCDQTLLTVSEKGDSQFIFTNASQAYLFPRKSLPLM